jgi:uncharacterized protein YjiS (DUF1127 family)
MPTTADHLLINCQPARVLRATSRGSLTRSIGGTLRLWAARFQERRVFPLLEERDLRDLRLSRWDVDRELAKPFWRG